MREIHLKGIQTPRREKHSLKDLRGTHEGIYEGQSETLWLTHTSNFNWGFVGLTAFVCSNWSEQVFHKGRKQERESIGINLV